jgi:hypothetical protein
MDFFELLGLKLVTGGELVEPPLLELQLFEIRLGLFVTDELKSEIFSYRNDQYLDLT